MSETIFTKIINGDIPSYKIYEDEFTYAFLDIHPIQPGHVLVIPKTPALAVWDLTNEEYAALMQTVLKVAQQMRQVLKPNKVGLKIEGLDVPHAHVHIIPFDTAEEFRAEPQQNIPAETLKAIAKKIAI